MPEEESLYQRRINTPQAHIMIQRFFKENPTYEGYEQYTELLDQCKEKISAIEQLQKQADELSDIISHMPQTSSESNSALRELIQKKEALEKEIEYVGNKTSFFIESRLPELATKLHSIFAIEIQQKESEEYRKKRELWLQERRATELEYRKERQKRLAELQRQAQAKEETEHTSRETIKNERLTIKNAKRNDAKKTGLIYGALCSWVSVVSFNLMEYSGFLAPFLVLIAGIAGLVCCYISNSMEYDYSYLSDSDRENNIKSYSSIRLLAVISNILICSFGFLAFSILWL